MTTWDRLAQAYDDIERRVDKAEELISDVRKATFGNDKTLAQIEVTLREMHSKWATLEKLLLAGAIGIMGLVGTEVWRLIVRH